MTLVRTEHTASRKELRPLPMRISQNSYSRLEKLRDLDDLTIQEHVRRAIDYYLEHAELALALAAAPQLADAVKAVRDADRKAGNPTPNKELIPKLINDHVPRPSRTPMKVGSR